MTILTADQQLRDVLASSTSIAVIGVTSKPERASHQVAAYLLEQTHLDVYLINPTFEGDILGQPVYKSLAELPVVPDIIDVFRKAEDMPTVFDKEFPAIKDHCAGVTWWMQLGITNDEVAQAAAEHGMNVVMDRCIKVDYMQLMNN